MFKFLKDKLKKAVSVFSKKVEDEVEETPEQVEEVKEEPVVEKIEKEESKVEEPAEEEVPEKVKEEKEEPSEDVEEEKQPVEEEKIPEEIKEEPKVVEEVPEKVEEVKEEPEEEKEEPSEDVEEEKQPVEEETPEKVEEPVEEKKIPEEIKEEPKVVEEVPEKVEEVKEEPEEEPKKKGFFGKVADAFTTTKLNDKKFDDLFWELELILLENNVAMEVIEKIKDDLRETLVNNPIKRSKIEDTIIVSLKNSISEVLSGESIDLLEKIKEKKPYVIVFVGINGSGKTTSIAKVANMFTKNGKKVVLAAADTFRAAAIDQLGIHADNLGIKMIKHDYGSDPAAVAFDAIKYAKSKEIDVVLIDTAGRLHSNTNLVDEMKKIIRISNPDLKLFVGEAITGNDCIEQATKFNDAIEIDGIILSKADIDEKGGASISVSYVTKKPVIYMGTGQEYDDLKVFDKDDIIKTLGLEA